MSYVSSFWFNFTTVIQSNWKDETFALGGTKGTNGAPVWGPACQLKAFCNLAELQLLRKYIRQRKAQCILNSLKLHWLNKRLQLMKSQDLKQINMYNEIHFFSKKTTWTASYCWRVQTLQTGTSFFFSLRTFLCARQTPSPCPSEDFKFFYSFQALLTLTRSLHFAFGSLIPNTNRPTPPLPWMLFGALCWSLSACH